VNHAQANRMEKQIGAIHMPPLAAHTLRLEVLQPAAAEGEDLQ
jgi:hypothetical protein